MKKLGVIGGLGPMATVYFLQLLVQMSQAKTDQEHMEILLHSVPQIPDRTGYIIGKSKENPLPLMAETGRKLADQGAEVIAIPCVTAHFFQQQLEAEIGVPVLNAIEETLLTLKSAGIERVGLMATDGTVQSGLFQKALEAADISCALPCEEGQKQVMHIIYEEVKAGKSVNLPLFHETAEELFRQDAQVVLLGCTELSLIKRDHPLRPGFLDVLEVLARKAVRTCGTLKQEYEKLITE